MSNRYSNDYFQKSLRILDLFSNEIFIKYTLIPAIPLFLLTVIAVDPYVWVGSGIDKETLPRLFDKFITRSPSETGLGLYICKNIVEAHGGNIWAKNNDENKGATFTFTLPIVPKKINASVK